MNYPSDSPERERRMSTIRITFEANSGEELRKQILAFLGTADHPAAWGEKHLSGPFGGPTGTTPPDDRDESKYRSPLVEPAPPADYQWRDGNDQVIPVSDVFPNVDTVAAVDSGEEPKKRRKHRRTKDLADTDVKTPAKTYVNVAEPQPEPLAEPQVEEPPEDDLIVPTPTSDAPSDALANEKLKNEVIAQLQDLFAAGKVRQIRGILDRYGAGAKSFPEVDAVHFTAIRDAIRSKEFA